MQPAASDGEDRFIFAPQQVRPEIPDAAWFDPSISVWQ
jgi:hypothetical protein